MSKPFGHDLQNEGSLERSQERMRINSDPKRIAEQSAHLRKIMGLPPKVKPPMNTTKQKRDWTLILSDSIGNTRYLYKYSGSAHINLVSTDETPLALSFLAKDAARLRFELEACRDSASAKHVVSHYAEYVKTVTVI